MEYPKVFEDLVECFKKMPGIGNKSAQRMVYQLLEMKKEDIIIFSNALLNLERINFCAICGHISEADICTICSNEHRNKNVICIVENFQDVFAMEKIKEFNGVYHVLHGCVSLIDGKSIDDLNIKSLFDRLNPNIEEIIIATNPTREGETTALYLAKILENKNLNISRIANGLPIGSSIDYADELTLLRSLEGRMKF